jgi:enoyl-CoA hydratase
MNSAAEQPVLLARQCRDVEYLTLNRPHRLNALNPALIRALNEAIARATANPDVRFVVIDGAGPSFCAGADLTHLRGLEDPIPFLSSVSGCFTRIEQCSKPVIAVLHGHAVAGGLELALACDIVIAEQRTLIGDGHVLNALLPAGGSSVRLPRKVGEPFARWLLLTGKLLPACAFTASGFVHEVGARADLQTIVDRLVTDLRAGDTAAQHNTKDLLAALSDLAPTAGLAAELDAFADNWTDAPVASALASFSAPETRTPEGGLGCP